MLARLVDHHLAMHDVTLVAEPLLVANLPAIEPLNATRQSLGELVASHSHVVRREVFEQVLAHGTTRDIKRARLLRGECDALESEFSTFVRLWGLADVEARWSAYQEDAVAFMWDLRARIAHISGIGAMLARVEAERDGGEMP